jgi:queuine/archaeosine tRNA-ribosyltransferase
MKKNLKLLLHSEDGFIPFMTPFLLKTYFSPDSPRVKNHLVVGMSMKDTCVVPVVGEKNKIKNKEDKEELMSNRQLKKKRRLEGKANSNQGEMKRQRNKDGNPVGINEGSGNNNNNDMGHLDYKFDSEYRKQTIGASVIGSYNVMTVPTFDLIDDVIQFSMKESKGKSNNYGKEKIPKQNKRTKGLQSSTIPPIATSNDQVTLCTPHGMQKLNIDTFINITMALNSDSIVGLYDQAHNTDTKKRKHKSLLRTETYLNKLIDSQANKEFATKKKIWSPLICNSTAIDNDDDSRSTTNLSDTVKIVLSKKDDISGICLIGWHHIQSPEKQTKLLQSCQESLKTTNLESAILVTKSLTQVINAARLGVNIIGTDLPSRWARSRKAVALSFSQGGERDSKLQVDEDGCIDLSEASYCEDKAPILVGCTCFSCKNQRYTRSYMHHLINAKELLAEILLFGHNLHQLLLLFDAVSNTQCVEEYCQFLENQFIKKY